MDGRGVPKERDATRWNEYVSGKCGTTHQESHDNCESARSQKTMFIGKDRAILGAWKVTVAIGFMIATVLAGALDLQAQGVSSTELGWPFKGLWDVAPDGRDFSQATSCGPEHGGAGRCSIPLDRLKTVPAPESDSLDGVRRHYRRAFVGKVGLPGDSAAERVRRPFRDPTAVGEYDPYPTPLGQRLRARRSYGRATAQ